MSLNHHDLRYTVSKKLSIDEFEPKTGKISDVLVLGFYVSDEEAAQDLYKFIDSGAINVNDVEVSPNPNPDNYFLVFVELARNDKVLKKIRKLVADIENLTGPLQWIASTHLTDEYYPLKDKEIEQYVITDPNKYMTRDEWEKARIESNKLAEEIHQRDNWIAEFLKSSLASTIQLDEQTLELGNRTNTAKIKIVAYGEAQEVLETLNIHDKAIKPLTSDFRRLNTILGEMRAVPIEDYIVIFHPGRSGVIVGEPCFS